MDLSEDLRRMNALLKARGQPTIRDNRTITRDGKLDTNRLISALLQIVYSQHTRIEALERQLSPDA